MLFEVCFAYLADQIGIFHNAPVHLCLLPGLGFVALNCRGHTDGRWTLVFDIVLDDADPALVAMVLQPFENDLTIVDCRAGSQIN